MRRFLTAMTMAMACNGCVGSASQPSLTVPDPPMSLVIDDSSEQALLSANNDVGRLLSLHQPRTPKGSTVTIHGINAAPDVVQPLNDRAVRRGHEVLTFIYDDQRRTLRESARDLADELLAHAGGRHGTLVIEAHSMGARIALEALNYLGSRIARLGDVQLVLIAPPLGGFAGANMAPYAPAFLRDVPGLLPGLDMGSHSALQTDLESMRLPASVVTRIYLGDRDGVVDAETPRFRLVVKRLRASVIRVSADHDGIVELVAMSGR